MISRGDIDRLAGLRCDNGVVSAYIKIDPRLAYERSQPAAKFKGAYSRTMRAANEQIRAVLEREHDRILDFLKGWEQGGRGLAIFSSEPDAIWEVQGLNVTVPSLVTAGDTPDTQFLARALDEYPRLAVVMLDGGHARIHLAEQGQDDVQGAVETDLPNRHDQGGWSQARYQRHVDFHHSMHLREVVDRLQEVFYKDGFTRLVVVGVDDATSEFENLLPDPIRRRLIARLNADFKQENDGAILARAGQAAEDDERSTEAALVQQVTDFAGERGRGALGLEETIRALVEGRVDTLVLSEGLNAEGSGCQNCGFFAAGRFDPCPSCSSEDVEHVPDVIELAVENALATGANVNFVYGGGAEMLQAQGGIGALLRYASPA